MMLPVPFIFVVALTFAFSLDTVLAWWLVGAIASVCVIATFTLRSAAPAPAAPSRNVPKGMAKNPLIAPKAI